MEKENSSCLSRWLEFFSKVPEWPARMINGQFGAVLIMLHLSFVSCLKFVKAKLDEKLHFKMFRNG